MEQSNKRWIIKDASGRISGPFTTEKILYKIGRGEFSGDEAIAHYPGGHWVPISTDPQFYDKLLEFLAARQDQPADAHTEFFEITIPKSDTQAGPEKAKPFVDDEATPAPAEERPGFVPPPPFGETESSAFGDEAPGGDAKRGDKVKVERRSKRRSKKRKSAEDIELEDIRPRLRQALFRRAMTPILVVALGAVLASLFWVNKAEKEQRIHLVGPHRNVAQEPPEALKRHVTSGVSHFVRDSFENYLKAQNEFALVVERNNKNSEVMALLCLTYMELWPFAFQDSADLRVIASVVQMSTVADPGGLHSATCRAVDLIVRGRYPEAKSLAETMIEQRTSEVQAPIVFYYLKGVLLESTGEHVAAVGYLRSAQQLWPQWIRPWVAEAQVQIRMEKYSDASNILRRVLQVNPTHAVSNILLGLMEYKYFNRFDVAERLLEAAVSGSSLAPRTELSKAYFGLAEISLKRGDSNQAVRYAQKAYSLNSSNAAAKNLIVQLGGIEKLRSTKVKGQQLVLEGDQFLREGDCQAAQAHYKAAYEEDPRDAVAAMKAAQCLWKLSFSTEATEWLNKAIRADPKLIEAYTLMADYLTQRYNFMAAAKILESAQRINPRSPDVIRGFGLVELRRGNSMGAIQYLNKAMQLYENDVDSQILMAKAYIALRDFRQAYGYALKATEIDVNNREAQVVYGEALAGYQGLDAGVDYLSKIVRDYPLVVDYRLALAKILMGDERYDQAEEVLRALLRFDEKPKEAFVVLAKVLRAQNNVQEALDLLLKAAVLDPADAEPLFIAGTIYLDTRKPLEAKTQFERVLRINKLYPLVHYQLGRVALLTGDAKTALEETRLEKGINPNLADAYLLAAEAHNALQQYSLCAGEYQKAIKLRPQAAIIYVKIAQCYRKAGNVDAAVAMLSMASSQESGLADIYKEQGAIFEVKGEIVKAIEAYNQYFVLDPEAPDRAQIEERINTLQRGRSY